MQRFELYVRKWVSEGRKWQSIAEGRKEGHLKPNESSPRSEAGGAPDPLVEPKQLAGVGGACRCACCTVPLGSVQLGGVCCIRLVFLEDRIANKQTLNCIMLKLLSNVSTRMKICISKTGIGAELIVSCYST